MPWLFVLNNARAARWVIENRRMAFKERARTDRLRPGDRFALYVTSGALKGQPRIVALGELATRPSSKGASVAGHDFPQSCSLRIEAACDPLESGLLFRPLIERLHFIKHKHAWSSSLYRTIVAIPDEDFDLISAEFGRRA